MKIRDKNEEWEEDYKYQEDAMTWVVECVEDFLWEKWKVVDLESDTKEEEANVEDLSMYELSLALDYEAPDLYKIYKSPSQHYSTDNTKIDKVN